MGGSVPKISVLAARLDVAACLLMLAFGGAAYANCEQPIAWLSAGEGSVEVRRAQAGAASAWQAAEREVPLCAGDAVRTGGNSRAALRLSNESTLRLDQSTMLVLAGFQDGNALLTLLRGALNVLTRTPKPFEVRTPFMNAGVEGTEFLLNVAAESTRVTVFEGKVRASNDWGVLMLTGGQLADAVSGRAPQGGAWVQPADAVQWALHYPNLLGADSTEDPGVRRAEALMRLGRIDEARAELDQVLARDPRSSGATAVRALIAVVRNERELALTLAQRAVEFDSKSATALMALSYADQARFRLEDALVNAEKAAALVPGSAMVWARVAELRMSLGSLAEALAAAERAAAADPALARAQSVLGFAHLVRFETVAARRAFDRAIAGDQSDPLARLGLGLAMIRHGGLTEGREQIEIAASLDPLNSLVRSYLGKAYFEERRDRLSGSQFELAKGYDPKDPTPHFYDALRQQAENRPVQALSELEKSIELNDGRAVYRSRLLLDQDAAARNASLARIYGDLGFDQLARNEGSRSVNADPSNHSAHRMLADAYSQFPGHDAARQSELLQSQMLQPLSLNVAPLQPHLGDEGDLGQSSVNALRSAFNEFGSLFERDGIAGRADLVTGKSGEAGGQVMLAGLDAATAWSLGHYRYRSNRRGEERLDENLYSLFIQSEVSATTGLQAELRHFEGEHRSLLSVTPSLRVQDVLKRSNARIRIGGRHAYSTESKLLVSASAMRTDADESIGSASFNASTEGGTLEFQHRWAVPHFNLVSGAGRFQARLRQENGSDIDRQTDSIAYTYAAWGSSLQHLRLMGGVAIQRFIDGAFARSRIHPKLGFAYDLSPNSTVRVAYFRARSRHLANRQTLEPTHVAGFNQVVDDGTGVLARSLAMALDHRASTTANVGFSAGRRRLTVPGISTDWRESTLSGYWYDTGSSRFSYSLQYEFQRLLRQLVPAPRLSTHRMPFALNVFNIFDLPGVSARLRATYVNQVAEFGPGRSSRQVNAFWLADARLSFRLPRRAGALSLEVQNVFGTRVRFEEVDPENPQIGRSRTMFLRATLIF